MECNEGQRAVRRRCTRALPTEKLEAHNVNMETRAVEDRSQSCLLRSCVQLGLAAKHIIEIGPFHNTGHGLLERVQSTVEDPVQFTGGRPGCSRSQDRHYQPVSILQRSVGRTPGHYGQGKRRRLCQLATNPDGARRRLVGQRRWCQIVPTHQGLIEPDVIFLFQCATGIGTEHNANVVQELETAGRQPSCFLRVFRMSLLADDSLIRTHDGVDDLILTEVCGDATIARQGVPCRQARTRYNAAQRIGRRGCDHSTGQTRSASTVKARGKRNASRQQHDLFKAHRTVRQQ